MKDKTGRIMLALGIITGLISFWYTLEFTWTPEFQATELEIGPTHSNYHAFREALLALAVNLLLIRAAIQGTKIRFEYWATCLFMVAFYYTGWWLAWPIWGYHAPYLGAELNHLMATVGGLVGLWIIRPSRT
ncbi:hypothetical protein [Marinomonas sp. PE14-40]|uniref:hypothetical protein n=1 Tax=Marinomonas sp. PE14-40 TaxID=3060621 RepID=UPI003F66605C